MKSKDLVLLCILAGIFYFTTHKSVNIVPGPLVHDLKVAEGMVAMDVNFNGNDVPDVQECKCNGTKKVRTPDGVSWQPCQCGEGCKCKRGDAHEVDDAPVVTVDEVPFATTEDDKTIIEEASKKELPKFQRMERKPKPFDVEDGVLDAPYKDVLQAPKTRNKK